MKSRKRSGGYRIFQGTRLDVPRAEKDDAKSAGARWNWRERYWYVPPWETDLGKFQRWLPANVARPDQNSSHREVRPISPHPAPEKTGWAPTIKRTLVGAIAICALVFILASAERKPYRGNAGARQASSYVSQRTINPGTPLVPNSPLLRSSLSAPAEVVQPEANKHRPGNVRANSRQPSGNATRGAPANAAAHFNSAPNSSAARSAPVDVSSTRSAPQLNPGRSGRLPVLVAALCKDGVRLKAAGQETCSQNGGVLAWVGADGTYIAPATPKTSALAGMRIGAWCRDGSRSYATGRGACSHHGGVAQWIIGE